METNSTTLAKIGRESEVYRAFRGLARDKRRKMALRILRDQRVLADLYDHFLIQEALGEQGRSTPWATHRRRKIAVHP